MPEAANIKVVLHQEKNVNWANFIFIFMHIRFNYKNKLCDYFLDLGIQYEELIKDNKELEETIASLYDFIAAKTT